MACAETIKIISRDCKIIINLFKNYFSKMELTRARIIEIAKQTIGQRTNPKWQEYRKNRLTGSIFGKALSKMRNSNCPFDLYFGGKLRDQILQNHPFETNMAMKWGIEHEAEAIEKYSSFPETR